MRIIALVDDEYNFRDIQLKYISIIIINSVDILTSLYNSQKNKQQQFTTYIKINLCQEKHL